MEHLLRRVLIVGQFIVSFILITGTIVVSQQIRRIKNKNLGFKKEQKIIIPIQQGVSIRDNFEQTLSSAKNTWENLKLQKKIQKIN